MDDPDMDCGPTQTEYAMTNLQVFVVAINELGPQFFDDFEPDLPEPQAMDLLAHVLMRIGVDVHGKAGQR